MLQGEDLGGHGPMTTARAIEILRWMNAQGAAREVTLLEINILVDLSVSTPQSGEGRRAVAHPGADHVVVEVLVRLFEGHALLHQDLDALVTVVENDRRSTEALDESQDGVVEAVGEEHLRVFERFRHVITLGRWSGPLSFPNATQPDEQTAFMGPRSSVILFSVS